jgi:hypothetical protein
MKGEGHSSSPLRFIVSCERVEIVENKILSLSQELGMSTRLSVLQDTNERNYTIGR